MRLSPCFGAPDSRPHRSYRWRRSPSRRSPVQGSRGRRRCIAPGQPPPASAPAHKVPAHARGPSVLLKTPSASSNIFHHRIGLNRTWIPKPNSSLTPRQKSSLSPFLLSWLSYLPFPLCVSAVFRRFQTSRIASSKGEGCPTLSIVGSNSIIFPFFPCLLNTAQR